MITLQQLRNILRLAVLLALLLVSVHDQYRLTLKPFISHFSAIPKILPLNDIQKLEQFAPDIYPLIQAINSYPPGTRFYFVPCFQDSGYNERWWWYVFLLTRYITYPRIILSHDPIVFQSNKSTYLEQIIGKASIWSDMDWIASRKVQFIILLRNSNVSIRSINTPVTKI